MCLNDSQTLCRCIWIDAHGRMLFEEVVLGNKSAVQMKCMMEMSISGLALRSTMPRFGLIILNHNNIIWLLLAFKLCYF